MYMKACQTNRLGDGFTAEETLVKILRELSG